MIIVNERKQALIVYKDGKIISKINDDYNRLKYNMFNGNRIFKKWDKDNKLTETYDDRIFNAVHKDKTVQIHGGYANRLASAVKENDVEEYEKLFKECYYIWHKTDIIKKVIDNSFNGYGDRVRQTPNKNFVIDERFMVDEHGVAHYGNDGKNKARRQTKDPRWNFLCIVVKRVGRKLVTHDGLEIELDSKMVEILAKINFLLYAEYHTNDSIFMNQLPPKISSQVKCEAKILMDQKSKKDIFKKREESKKVVGG